METLEIKSCELRGSPSGTIRSQALSLEGEGSTTIPKGSTAKRLEAHDTLSSQVEGDEMVWSMGQPIAACNDAGSGVAYTSEQLVSTNSDRYFSSDLGWSRWWSIWCSWKRRCIGSYAKWKWQRVKLIGTFTEKSVSKTPLIAGKSRTDNPQPSPKGKVQRLWQDASSSKRSETGGISASKVGDCEIVCPVWEHAAVSFETGIGVASYLEHVSYVSEISGSTSRELHVLSPTRLRGKRSSTFCRNRCTNHNAWVSLTPLQSAMIVEKFREFRGTLRNEAILSEVWSSDQERATTMDEDPVHNKRLVVEARNTFRGDDIVSPTWRQVAAHDGAVFNVAIDDEGSDYKSVIEIA